MNKKTLKLGEASWIIGNILCALGNCLVSKSKFGLSAIIAPAFILHEKIEFLSIGFCEYIIQGILLTLCCIIIGKFKPQFIATICNIIFYGAVFDIINALLGFIQPQDDDIPLKILLAIIGTLITSFAVALMLRTYIPPSIYEIFVKEVAVAKGFKLVKTKLVFDASMLALSFILMFTLIGEYRFDFIGILTIISAFLNSILIAWFGKLIDKHLSFEPAIPKLYEILYPKTK
jgi:uncharacterized membrane protein YczE